MTNLEIYEIIFDEINHIIQIDSVDVKDEFKGDKQSKEITIWRVNEDDAQGHNILESFSIPVNADKELVKKYANACLSVDLLEDRYLEL
jgi:hypothetical protein